MRVVPLVIAAACHVPDLELPVPQPESPRQLAVTEKEVPYPVHGATWDAIQTSMRGQAEALAIPKDGDEQLTGYHSAKVKWHWSYWQDADGCEPADERVDISTVIFLPTWEADEAKGDRALVDRWATYRGRLAAHEHTHRTIALAHAGAIVDALAALGSFASCDELDVRANALANEVWAKETAEQADFDVATDHGKKPAAWPASASAAR